MNTDLPYIVEYAKSNRSSCKACKENIGKDSLRMGVMVQVNFLIYLFYFQTLTEASIACMPENR